MRKSKKHSNKQEGSIEMNALPEVDIAWSKSKEEVWDELTGIINPLEHEVKKVGIINNPWAWRSFAAVLLVALASIFFLNLFSRTIHSPAGKHMVALLPDGSSVELNANSFIEYKPFWWYFERKVTFEGEAFFKVKKGETFEVNSFYGRTIVLGTSFNIYARKEKYKVTCFTGRVKVISVKSGNSAEIISNESVSVESDGELLLSKEVDIEETISWVNDMFIFTRTPIALVFQEIELQYGIAISTTEKLSYLYSGNFTRDRPVQEVLQMICRPLGLKFQAHNGGFVVTK